MKYPKVIIKYNGKDISEDLSSHLISIDYEDNSEGSSDEISLTLDDVSGLWKSSWYPTKGDTLEVSIGFEGQLMNCGTFEIDEIELTGPPDVVSIRGLAAGITKALRTKKAKAYDKQTLKQIAEKVASENGLTVEGDVPNIKLERVTQHRETDLAFLKRISYEYGCLFSVRDKKLIFTSVFDIEKADKVAEVDRTEMLSFSFRDKAVDVYQKAVVKFHNPDNNEVQKAEVPYSYVGEDFEQPAAKDTYEIRTKAENKQQAEQKAKAAIQKSMTKEFTGRVTVSGNPLLVAGNNVNINGLGVVSGKYHIEKSSHKVTRSGGYTTDIQLKKVAKGDAKQTAKQPTQESSPVIGGGGFSSSSLQEGQLA